MEFLVGFWSDHWIFAICILTLIAFVAGFVDSVAGGGGLFLVPGFLLVGLPPQVALGQEKVVSTLGTVAAIRNFIRDSQALWKVILLGIPFSLAGSYVGARTVLFIHPDILEKLLLVLIPVGIIIFLVPKNRPVQEDAGIRGSSFLVPLICFSVGFYDGFFGPGTGSIFVIVFHYALKMNLLTASANAKFFNLSSNVGALVAFVMADKVIYQIAAPLVIGNIVGNHLGSKLAIRNGSGFVRRVLVFSMIVLFLSLLVKTFY